MTELKVRARLIVKGRIMKLWAEGVLPFVLSAISFLVFLVPLFCIFYTPTGVLPYFENNAAAAVSGGLAAAALLLFLFALIRKCYSEASVFFSLDKNGTAPESYYKFSQGLRFMRMKILILFYKLLWGTVFMFPSVFLFYTLFAVTLTSDMIKSVFFILLAAGTVLFICGLLFFYSVNSRYFLCEYLFYLYPLSPAGSIVKSSVLLSTGKLLYITRCRLSIIPWKLFGIFIFTLPFSRAYAKCIRAVTAEYIYGERKCRTKKPAVVFYIGKHSVFELAGDN